MATDNYPIRVNNNQFDYGSYVFKVNGTGYSGITDITYDQKRDRTKLYGMGRDRGPIGKTPGKYEAGTLKITCYAATASKIERDLATAAGNASYGDLRFPIVLQLTEPGTTEAIVIQFNDCTHDGDTLGGATADSSDSAKVEISFSPLTIIKNGKQLYSAR